MSNFKPEVSPCHLHCESAVFSFLQPSDFLETSEPDNIENQIRAMFFQTTIAWGVVGGARYARRSHYQTARYGNSCLSDRADFEMQQSGILPNQCLPLTLKCLSMFTNVYQCLPISTNVYQCLPMFSNLAYYQPNVYHYHSTPWRYRWGRYAYERGSRIVTFHPAKMFDAQASLAPNPVSPSVGKCFRISILSVSLSSHKASR